MLLLEKAENSRKKSMVTKNKTIEKDFALFVKGFFEGAFNKTTGDIEKCIKDIEITIEDIEEGIKELMHNSTTPEEIVRALVDFGKALQQLLPDYEDCKELPEEVEDLIKWIEALGNTEQLTIKVLEAFFRHHKQCTADVKAAISDFEAHDFEHCGYDVGELFALIFE